jgi:hypothetical protein
MSWSCAAFTLPMNFFIGSSAFSRFFAVLGAFSALFQLVQFLLSKYSVYYLLVLPQKKRRYKATWTSKRFA